MSASATAQRPVATHRVVVPVPTESADAAGTDDEVIQAYSRVLQARDGPFGRQADLPFSKDRIRAALVKALKDPVYQPGERAVEAAILALDTYMLDREIDATEQAFRRATELAQSTDEDAFKRYLEELPLGQRRAIAAVFEGLTH